MGKFRDYMNTKRILKRLERVETILIERLDDMSVQLDELEVQVAETIGIEQSAIALLEGISDRLTELAEELAAAGIDNEKVLALRDELDASEQALAAAVAAVPPVEPV